MTTPTVHQAQHAALSALNALATAQRCIDLLEGENAGLTVRLELAAEDNARLTLERDRILDRLSRVNQAAEELLDELTTLTQPAYINRLLLNLQIALHPGQAESEPAAAEPDEDCAGDDIEEPAPDRVFPRGWSIIALIKGGRWVVWQDDFSHTIRVLLAESNAQLGDDERFVLHPALDDGEDFIRDQSNGDTYVLPKWQADTSTSGRAA